MLPRDGAALSVVLLLLLMWIGLPNKANFGLHVQAFFVQTHSKRTLGNGVNWADVTIQSSSQLYWGFFGRDKVSSKGEESSVESNEKPDSVKTSKVGTMNGENLFEKPLTPEEEASRLRSEAARSRLEAERMDAELTLRKIEKLEKELKKQQLEIAMSSNSDAASSNVSNMKKSPQDLQREIDVLLKKVKGESTVAMTTSSSDSKTTLSSARTDTVMTPSAKVIWPNYVEPFDEKEYESLCENLKSMPQFVLRTLALQVEIEMETDAATEKLKPINVTELAIRLDRLRRRDFSYSRKVPPSFSTERMSEVESKVSDFLKSESDQPNVSRNWWGGLNDENMFFSTAEIGVMIQNFRRDERYKVLWDDRNTKSLAQLILEYQYYMDQDMEKQTEQIVQIGSEEEWLKPFIGETNVSGTNAVVESLYPKCTTKKDMVAASATIPSEALVQKLVKDILPKASFKVTSRPEPVLGGFVLRGNTQLSGDAFIDQLDSLMERSNLKDQMTVLYVNDFTILGEEVMFDGAMDAQRSSIPEDGPPVLYITAPSICRDPLPFRLSIVSAAGLATTWYLSVYPFLLNPGIAARVDEQLAIADANMVPDLSWLSDLSVPLFATFMSLQLSHELGHLIVAGANGVRHSCSVAISLFMCLHFVFFDSVSLRSSQVKTSPPTFVPSLFTGITSTVTTFRTPPKNTATMFDYAIAGPVAGMVTSILAIAVGCQLTAVTSDASLLPALPLEILRQSTLGGGVIECVLGDNALSLPKAAIGTAAVTGMTIPLHPVAIAGYISLIVNALAMLPVGSKSEWNCSVRFHKRFDSP
jgi:hypothetical protein